MATTINKLEVKLKSDDKKYWDSVKNKYKNKDNKLNEYLNFDKGRKDQFNKSLNQQRDHGVCGPGRFVKNAISRQSHDYSKETLIGGDHDPCHKCVWDKKKNYKTFLKNNNKGNVFPSDVNSYNKMCHDNALIWYPSQNEEDPFINKFMDKKKFDITVNENDPDATVDPMLLKWVTERMYDDEIKCLVAGDGCMHKGIVDNYNQLKCGDNKPCTSVEDVKDEIINYGDSPRVSCNFMNNKFNSQIKEHDNYINIESRKFTSKCESKSSKTLRDIGYIIPEQYRQWENKIIKEKHSGKKDINLGDMGLKVNPPTPAFERRMNNIFSSSDIQHDESMIDEISDIEDPADLQPKHINYIKKKFLAFLSESNHDALKQAISKDLYPDESICSVTLPEQMATILGVIFKVIGIRFKQNSLSEPENQPLLREMINIFGDLIPRVFNKFIILSESVEKSNCGGVTDGTLNLRMLYNKLFKKSKNVVNFDLGIMDMINDATPQQFDRSTILMMLGIAFLKFF
jgi:hypothetical protein